MIYGRITLTFSMPLWWQNVWQHAVREKVAVAQLHSCTVAHLDAIISLSW